MNTDGHRSCRRSSVCISVHLWLVLLPIQNHKSEIQNEAFRVRQGGTLQLSFHVIREPPFQRFIPANRIPVRRRRGRFGERRGVERQQALVALFFERQQEHLVVL